MRAGGRVGRAQLAFAHGRVVETDGHPVVLGEWLGAPRRADDPRLRPLRRAAGRRRGRLGRRRRSRRASATAASTPAARPTTRARCSWPLKVAEAFLDAGRRAPAKRPLPVRGRGGDRQPEPRRVSSASIATSSPPISSSRPTARCGARRSRRSRSPRRDWSRSTSSSPARRPTCTPAGTAAPSRTRCTRSRGSSRACTTPHGAVAVAGFYDDVAAALRRRP